MSLKEQLAADAKSAMKNRAVIKKNTIQMVRAAILQVEKDNKVVLDDNDVLDVIAKEVKKRKDVLPDYLKSGREDLIANLNEEINVLLDYLPPQLDEESLTAIVKDAIIATSATTIKDMGKIMAEVMPKVKGRADGKAINAVVKNLL